MSLSAAELLAAIAYATDVTPESNYFHVWRTALVAERLAAVLTPDARQAVFGAALIQEVGAVGAENHVSTYKFTKSRIEDPAVKRHAGLSSTIIEWLPGLHNMAPHVAAHHQWWNGRRFNDGRGNEDISIISQIMGIADATDVSDCFQSPQDLINGLRSLAPLTGKAWCTEVWSALVESTKDGDFYRRLMHPEALPEMIRSKLDELGVPPELDCEKGVEQLLHVIAVMVDLKDPSTKGHSMRTAKYAKHLAERMNLSEEEHRMVYRAGLVHDVGRLGIPTTIINRSGRLNDREMRIVRQHARMTMRCLSCIPNCPDMTELGMVASHDHERYDGGGYPDGMTAGEIPLLSRILSVVDAFDAMISPTNYRLLSPRAAVLRLEQGAGTQFDPDVVGAMLSLINSGELFEEMMSVA